MKTLKEKIAYEARAWATVLTESVNLKEDDDYNDKATLEKIIERMMQEGANLTKNHIKNTIDLL
jgi:uncharacterized protein YpuA (DUF1002 family)